MKKDQKKELALDAYTRIMDDELEKGPTGWDRELFDSSGEMVTQLSGAELDEKDISDALCGVMSAVYAEGEGDAGTPPLRETLPQKSCDTVYGVHVGIRRLLLVSAAIFLLAAAFALSAFAANGIVELVGDRNTESVPSEASETDDAPAFPLIDNINFASDGTVLINKAEKYVCFAQLEADLEDTNLHILMPKNKEQTHELTCLMSVGADGIDLIQEKDFRMIYYVFADQTAGYAFLTGQSYSEDTIRTADEYVRSIVINNRTFYIMNLSDDAEAILFDSGVMYHFTAPTETELMQMLEMLE